MWHRKIWQRFRTLHPLRAAGSGRGNRSLARGPGKICRLTEKLGYVPNIAAIVPQIKKSIETELKQFLSPPKIITLRQDVREFHNMINSVAAEHLGAIQVLGFLLGAVIGLFQLLI